jgi:osmotically-inducible protein OsmY
MRTKLCALQTPTEALAAHAAGASAFGLLCVSNVHASEADDRLQSSFVASHVYKTHLKSDAITFTAKDGVVTLTGTVVDPAHRMLAEEVAAGMTGVQKVDNRITAAGTETANADVWIGRKISMALLFHSNVNAGRTTVTVHSGVVTLTGTAVSEAQRDLTTAYAKDIDGVTDVKNEMVVVAGPATPERSAGEKIDDAASASEQDSTDNQYSLHHTLAKRAPADLNLKLLAEAQSASDAIAQAAARTLVPVLPVVERRESGAVLVIPPEAGYGAIEEPMTSIRA